MSDVIYDLEFRCFPDVVPAKPGEYYAHTKGSLFWERMVWHPNWAAWARFEGNSITFIYDVDLFIPIHPDKISCLNSVHTYFGYSFHKER